MQDNALRPLLHGNINLADTLTAPSEAGEKKARKSTAENSHAGRQDLIKPVLAFGKRAEDLYLDCTRIDPEDRTSSEAVKNVTVFPAK